MKGKKKDNICLNLPTANWWKTNQILSQVRGDRWVSYDDEHSVRLKAEFAFDMKLAGVMVWSVETDDFKVNIIIIFITIIIIIIAGVMFWSVETDDFKVNIIIIIIIIIVDVMVWSVELRPMILRWTSIYWFKGWKDNFKSYRMLLDDCG